MNKLFRKVIGMLIASVVFCWPWMVSTSFALEMEEASAQKLSEEALDIVFERTFDHDLSFSERYAACKIVESDFSCLFEGAISDEDGQSIYNVLSEYLHQYKSAASESKIMASESVGEIVNEQEIGRAQVMFDSFLDNGITIVERLPSFEVQSAAYADEKIVVEVFEWSFFIYEYNKARSIFGMGFDHQMTFEMRGNQMTLTEDEYDDMFLTRTDVPDDQELSATEGENAAVVLEGDTAIVQSEYTPTSTAYCYSPARAVQFSYDNLNAMNVEDGCARFVSACLAEGGLPTLSSWSRCTVMLNDLLSYSFVGDMPSYGDVVFYKWYADNTYWHHTAICVGTDSSTGLPVVNAVNNLVKEGPWEMYAYATCVISPIHYGDLDFNLNVNTTDSRLALQAAAGRITLTNEQFRRADVNHDGKVNTTDSRIILQYAGS